VLWYLYVIRYCFVNILIAQSLFAATIINNSRDYIAFCVCDLQGWKPRDYNISRTVHTRFIPNSLVLIMPKHLKFYSTCSQFNCAYTCIALLRVSFGWPIVHQYCMHFIQITRKCLLFNSLSKSGFRLPPPRIFRCIWCWNDTRYFALKVNVSIKVPMPFYLSVFEVVIYH
jgi:hypothetical protein